MLLIMSTSTLYGNVAYVSTSIGSDSNDGYTSSAPLHSIKKALAMADTVLLRCGDSFFECEVELYGKTLSYYGQGTKPLLCGFKVLEKPKWEPAGENVWRLSLSDEFFSGVHTGGSSRLNNIGCIYDMNSDRIHGYKCRFREELHDNWDFWQTSHIEYDTPASYFDYIYMYYDGNPNTLHLAFSVGCSGVYMHKSVIDGISICGFGFGISARTECIIRNVSLDIIGGMTQLGYPEFICYGNGIEFYVSENIRNCLVENCSISRCYDCGITIQASDCGKATPSNIIIRNNLITRCCQGFEEFLRNDPDVYFCNCIFEDNLLMENGNVTGWKYPEGRFKYCHILSNDFTGPRGMIVRNNVFIGGNLLCASKSDVENYHSIVWEDNVCYISNGNFLIGNYVGTADVIRVDRSNSTDSIERYRKLSGDSDTRFVICGDFRQRLHYDFISARYGIKSK